MTTTLAKKPATVTPMMQQYLDIKEKHRDYLLFYRMGDFYELFFDDAVQASEALGIALTKRGKHVGEDIPMCGVPAHSHESYLQQLIGKGFKVAVCEQMESPEEAKKRGYKAVVKRDVVRIVTPGTITEDTLLASDQHHYLAAMVQFGGGVALAWLDISTGDFYVMEVAAERLAAELARIQPRELLVSERFSDDGLRRVLDDFGEALTLQPTYFFDSRKGEETLKSAYQLLALDSLGDLSQVEIAVCGALVNYVELTQKEVFPRLDRPRRQDASAQLVIDAATRRNLELVTTLAGERKGSLLAAIDRTVTGPGARLLARRLSAPLVDPVAINRRLDGVQALLDHPSLRDDVRTVLKSLPDLERALSRIHLGRAGPRDLAMVRDGLAVCDALKANLEAVPSLPEMLQEVQKHLGEHDVLVDTLSRALKPDLGLLARDGNFIADGYSTELDEHRRLRDEGKRVIAAMQQKYADEVGVSTLKIRHNNVLGYYIEVTQKHQEKIPETFIHRQTLASNLRYSTPELNEMARKIGEAGERALELELQLFAELCAAVIEKAEAVTRAARAAAALDVAVGLATLAVEQRYCRPVVDDSDAFAIIGGRHPVVEQALDADIPFIGNDCDLANDQRLWLITGPNMAGKSTFLRQNALIAILAQMGSYVPAESAQLGVVDRLFSRVGAADDLARGRSTFMVEMVETATILHQATVRSLVILDEIGRGTATFDGLSIAWAVIEHLHEKNRCRSLFATHYHELTHLSARLDALSCRTMRVKEWQGEVIFLHEVVSGTADRSYGIHVAKLAGLPGVVIARSEEILTQLEQDERTSTAAKLAEDLPLFSFAEAGVHTSALAEPSELERRVATLDPDSMTPKEALEALYGLKEVLK